MHAMNDKLDIGFLLAAEFSCFNAAFGLAHALEERGHNIVFFVGYKSMLWDYVEAHGFKAAKSESLIAGRTTQTARSIGTRLLKRMTQRARGDKQGQDGPVASIKLDLCLIDSMRDDLHSSSTLLAETGVQTILLTANFASAFHTGYPPVFSSMRPVDTKTPAIGSRIIFAWLWLWAGCTPGRAFVVEPLQYLKHSIRKMFHQIPDIRWEWRQRRFGWSSSWSEWKRRLLIPEIVLCHRALDWPAIATTAERFYFGATDLFRRKVEFDWSAFDSNRPLVYCAVSTAGRFKETRDAAGSQTGKRVVSRKKEFAVTKRYLDVVIDAFSRHEEWQLILACGPFYELLSRGSVSPNIHLFKRVPQLAVLERADLAITWGGAGTIRECVNFGVPMLVFPVWTDQFGNAARVLSRNLGIRGHFLRVSPTQMTEMVGRLLNDKAIRSSVDDVQRQLSKDAEMDDLIRFVGRYTSLQL